MHDARIVLFLGERNSYVRNTNRDVAFKRFQKAIQIAAGYLQIAAVFFSVVFLLH